MSLKQDASGCLPTPLLASLRAGLAACKRDTSGGLLNRSIVMSNTESGRWLVHCEKGMRSVEHMNDKPFQSGDLSGDGGWCSTAEEVHEMSYASRLVSDTHMHVP
jgi:hypothetical protein